jgi:hypothetical protein
LFFKLQCLFLCFDVLVAESIATKQFVLHHLLFFAKLIFQHTNIAYLLLQIVLVACLVKHNRFLEYFFFDFIFIDFTA